jgi:hypothetical protein
MHPFWQRKRMAECIANLDAQRSVPPIVASRDPNSVESGFGRSLALTKVLIMLVRLLALAAISLGGLLWAGHERYLAPHLICGFLLAAVVFLLAVMALIKHATIPGILGVLFAVFLPVVGLKQLPLTFHTLGAIQVAHVVVALATIGVAESLYAAIRRPR